MSSLFILLLFAAFIPAIVAENHPSPRWLRWLQRPLCSLLHAHNQHEWEQRGCADDVHTSWTTEPPAFPSKPLFSLSPTKPTQITQKHTMVVCLQGLAKDHKETRRQPHQPSQLHREGLYGMNYFSRMLGLMGPADRHEGQIIDNEVATAEAATKTAANTMHFADFSSGMRAEDNTEYHSSYPSTPWSDLSLNPTDTNNDSYDKHDDEGVSVSDSCAEGDER